MARTPFTRRFDLYAIALLLAHGACSIDVSEIPVHDTSPAQSPADAAVDNGELGEAGTDASALPEGEAGLGTRIIHEGCREAMPAPEPLAPRIATTACGRPEFDLFHDWHCEALAEDPQCATPTSACGRPEFDLTRDLGCAAIAGKPQCDTPASGDPLACTQCLRAGRARDQAAVCVPFAERACIAVAHGDGCIACVPAAVKAQACCLGLARNCRPWPFEGESARGELCARHSDCEPGLVCKGVAGELRFALCECPESPPPVVSVNECLSERAP